MSTLDVDPSFTYALTPIGMLRVARFFINELKPVEITNPADRECPICVAGFATNILGLHRAVRLPCNHIFGESCIRTWLSPVMAWKTTSTPPEIETHANTCPMCRQVFFPAQTIPFADLPTIEARIKVWDAAYAYVGIALSRSERRARDDLLKFLEGYARGSDRARYFKVWSSLPQTKTACADLLRYCQRLKRFSLTSRQEDLRQRLEVVAGPNFPGRSEWVRNSQGDWIYKIE